MTALIAAMQYPNLKPVAFEVGPLQVRWYALSYLAGLLIGMFILHRRGKDPDAVYKPDHAYDYLIWCTRRRPDRRANRLRALLSGRLFRPASGRDLPDVAGRHVLSRSFGVIGVILATVLFTHFYRIHFAGFGDEIAAAAPIGLFFGRMANFANGELWGRESDVPWAMVFPGAGSEPRHPSQLYEAVLEGLVLFIAINIVRARWMKKNGTGMLIGVFLIGYGIARFIVEFFREPDENLGHVLLGATMGQLLTIPMVAAGVWLIVRARRMGPNSRPPPYREKTQNG